MPGRPPRGSQGQTLLAECFALVQGDGVGAWVQDLALELQVLTRGDDQGHHGGPGRELGQLVQAALDELGPGIVENPFLVGAVQVPDPRQAAAFQQVGEDVGRVGGDFLGGRDERNELGGVTVTSLLVSNNYLYGVAGQVELRHQDVFGREAAPRVGWRGRDRRYILTADHYRSDPEVSLEVLAR